MCNADGCTNKPWKNGFCYAKHRKLANSAQPIVAVEETVVTVEETVVEELAAKVEEIVAEEIVACVEELVVAVEEAVCGGLAVEENIAEAFALAFSKRAVQPTASTTMPQTFAGLEQWHIREHAIVTKRFGHGTGGHAVRIALDDAYIRLKDELYKKLFVCDDIVVVDQIIMSPNKFVESPLPLNECVYVGDDKLKNK